MGLTLNSGFTIGPGVTLASRLPISIVTAGMRFNVSSLTNWAGVTPTGSPAFTDGKYLKFTGSEYLTTDYIDNTTIANNDVTYEFWLRTTGTNSGCLLSKRGDGGYFVSAVEVSDTNLVPGYWVGSGTGYDASTPNITRDDWQHYTVTYTTGGALKTYYNGSLVHSTTFGTEVAPRDYGAANEWFDLFKSEATNFGHGGALTGDLGEFRLYTRALSDAEVKQNFRATAPRWGIATAPTGLTSNDASTSAWQIKQDYPASTDGLYWIQNPNINSGNPVQIYADMTTLGGGWTLILQNNNAATWSFDNCLLYNQTTPPSTLANGAGGEYNAANNYSIIGWADHIKRAPSGFDYMLDATTHGHNGGAWTVNSAYSFVDRASSSTFWGSDPVNGTDGFHQNVTNIALFDVTINDNGIENRMPWYANSLDNPGTTVVGGAIFTTSHNDNSAWWGSLMTIGQQAWDPAPWQAGNNNPYVIWYWVR